MWASEDGIPFGRLRGENRYQPHADGRSRQQASRGARAGGSAPAGTRASPRRRRKRGGAAEPRSQGESGDPFGRNEPAGQSERRGLLMSPGFWPRHAALAWQQAFDRWLRLLLTPEGRELVRPSGDSLRETLQHTSRPGVGRFLVRTEPSREEEIPSPSRACPQRDSNPCRRLERAVSWATRRWGRRRLRPP